MDGPHRGCLVRWNAKALAGVSLAYGHLVRSPSGWRLADSLRSEPGAGTSTRRLDPARYRARRSFAHISPPHQSASARVALDASFPAGGGERANAVSVVSSTGRSGR